MADTTKKASVQIVNEEQENMTVTEVETTEEENKTLIRMIQQKRYGRSMRLSVFCVIRSVTRMNLFR